MNLYSLTLILSTHLVMFRLNFMWFADLSNCFILVGLFQIDLQDFKTGKILSLQYIDKTLFTYRHIYWRGILDTSLCFLTPLRKSEIKRPIPITWLWWCFGPRYATTNTAINVHVTLTKCRNLIVKYQSYVLLKQHWQYDRYVLRSTQYEKLKNCWKYSAANRHLWIVVV